MTACTRPAANYTLKQLRFPPPAGFTVRADFTEGELSSDLGALLLCIVDRRIGLIDRLSVAINDSRHPSCIKNTYMDSSRFANKICDESKVQLLPYIRLPVG